MSQYVVVVPQPDGSIQICGPYRSEQKAWIMYTEFRNLDLPVEVHELRPWHDIEVDGKPAGEVVWEGREAVRGEIAR
jgi:hypothetical protein